MTESKWNFKEGLKGRNIRVIGPVQEEVEVRMKERDSHRDTKHLHPSEMAKNEWCSRATWYKMHDTEKTNPDSLDLRRMNILAEGNNIHDKWQNWIWDTGMLFGTFGCKRCGGVWEDQAPDRHDECGAPREELVYKEIPIKQESIKMIGHADGGISDYEGEALIEIKSVGLGTIRWDAPNLYQGYADGKVSLEELWKLIKRPLKSHLRQVYLYMWATGIHKAIVIYEWKPDQSIKEFHVEFDYELIRDRVEQAKQLLDDIDNNIMPDRYPGAMRSKMPCRFCDYKKGCFGDA